MWLPVSGSYALPMFVSTFPYTKVRRSGYGPIFLKALVRGDNVAENATLAVIPKDRHKVRFQSLILALVQN